MALVEAIALTQKIGIIRPSRYLVMFSGPGTLIPAAANIRLSITCEECTLPGRSLYTSEHRIHGPQRKVPFVTAYLNEFTMTFRVGTDMYEKRVFEEWMDSIVDPVSFDFEYYNNYVQTLEIMQLGNSVDGNAESGTGTQDFLKKIADRAKTGILTNLGLNDFDNHPLIRIGEEKSVYTARINEVYPIGTQEVMLAHSQNDQYTRFMVTFAYKDWQPFPDLSPGEIAQTGPVSYEHNNTNRTFGIDQVVDIGSRTISTIKSIDRGQILPF